ncbi:MAG: phosphoadenosine phosphosulfate reductase [Pseudomonadota bacterium]
MKDLSSLLQADLSGLDWDAWCERLDDLAGDDGYCDPLGPDHAALLIEKKPVLLITFETRDRLMQASAMGHPMAWPMTEALGWSHMALFSTSDTWFRDPYVYAYFDRLVDDGFFDDFEEVVFYGAGPAGYAACAFSVAVPGARVLALSPQATLDPARAGWDKRHITARRRDFNTRYGYAPDMLQAADHAWIVFNPDAPEEAMHATLFTADNITLVPTRFLGPDLQNALLRMNILYRMLAQISSDRLTIQSLATLLRARRADGGYLSNLMVHLEQRGQFRRMKTLCAAALKERESRPIRRGLIRATRALEEG